MKEVVIMIESISKDKIPNKYAFVLKTGQLENVLVHNDIDIHIDLIYRFSQESGSILDVHFWPPNANISYNRLYIRAGALPKEDVFTAREKMTEIVLPEFAAWVKSILALPCNSPQSNKEMYFYATFQNGKLEMLK